MEEISIFILLLPVLAAGVVHGLVIRQDLWPGLARPLDGGRTWGAQAILGPNKTVRGLLVMVVATGLASAVILPLVPPRPEPPAIGWLGLGLLMGLAYCLAELPNSFIKRRMGVPAGQAAPRGHRLQYLIDQADSVVGVVVVIALTMTFTPWALLAFAVVGVAVHAGFDVILHATGVKHSPAVSPSS